MGVADRTLKTFDYISKGLLPLDDFLRSGGEALEEQILDREKSGKKADGQKKRGEEGLDKAAMPRFAVDSKKKVLKLLSYIIVVTIHRGQD